MSILSGIIQHTAQSQHSMGSSINFYRDVAFHNNYKRLQLEFTKNTILYDTSLIRFPLSTKGMAIVDALGTRVKIVGGSWSGGHAARHCLSGLDRRPLQDLIADIKFKFVMNCVRVTFSLELFRKREGKHKYVNPQFVKANKCLYGRTAKEIFVYTVEELTRAGLMVILNNHTSKSQWCCSDSDGDGLWFNEEYPEAEFFQCLEDLAQEFSGNQLVVGMDLRNEIRPSKTGKPTWGDGSKFDWRLAAQTIANRIHRHAPHMLIIVGGLNYQLDLTPIRTHPLKLDAPNKLVYSGHLYGFSWGPEARWKAGGETWFREKLYNEQLFVRGMDQVGVPFILGEFGDNCRSEPWKYLIRYLRELDLDWIYWCLDGYKCDDQQDQTYGLWNYDYTGVRHKAILQDLRKIGKP